MTLTINHLDSMVHHPDWQGFGYLAERQRYKSENPQFCEILDRVVLQRANELGLTESELFEWANSKRGRWYVSSMVRRTHYKWRNPEAYLDNLPTKGS